MSNKTEFVTDCTCFLTLASTHNANLVESSRKSPVASKQTRGQRPFGIASRDCMGETDHAK